MGLGSLWFLLLASHPFLPSTAPQRSGSWIPSDARDFPICLDIFRWVGMCGHSRGLGTLEPVEIYMNQRSKMQAAAFQNKKPGCDKGAHDPDYENITLAFRNRDQSKPNQSAPKKQAPVHHRTSTGTSQVPPWLHRAIMILYILLALIFLFCIVLSALVLVKNSEMSGELLSLKVELSNVSNTVQSYQNQQRDQWIAVQREIQEAVKNINAVKSKVQSGDDKLKTLSADITHIKKTLEALEKKTNTQPSK